LAVHAAFHGQACTIIDRTPPAVIAVVPAMLASLQGVLLQLLIPMTMDLYRHVIGSSSREFTHVGVPSSCLELPCVSVMLCQDPCNTILCLSLAMGSSDS
jgi:hypothetical protein